MTYINDYNSCRRLLLSGLSAVYSKPPWNVPAAVFYCSFPYNRTSLASDNCRLPTKAYYWSLTYLPTSHSHNLTPSHNTLVYFHLPLTHVALRYISPTNVLMSTARLTCCLRFSRCLHTGVSFVFLYSNYNWLILYVVQPISISTGLPVLIHRLLLFCLLSVSDCHDFCLSI